MQKKKNVFVLKLLDDIKLTNPSVLFPFLNNINIIILVTS